MIITRSPARISLGGGGTDLPSYYREHEGFLIAAAIDKYVYLTIHQTFVDELIIKYSKMERVPTAAEIQHPIIREALQLLEISQVNLEISSMADIPAGTGLGSSGSFGTALLKALHTLRKNLVHPSELAAQACHIEIDRLGEPVGKQDQYIAAYGGVTCFRFLRDDTVEALALQIADETLYTLEDNLVLFFTGYSRSASVILKDQDDRSKRSDISMIENLHFTKEIGLKSKDALESGDLRADPDSYDHIWGGGYFMGGQGRVSSSFVNKPHPVGNLDESVEDTGAERLAALPHSIELGRQPSGFDGPSGVVQSQSDYRRELK